MDDADSKTLFSSSMSLIVLRSIISKGSSHRSQSATLNADDVAPNKAASPDDAAWEDEEEEEEEGAVEGIAVDVRVDDAFEKLVDITEEGGRTLRALSRVLG